MCGGGRIETAAAGPASVGVTVQMGLTVRVAVAVGGADGQTGKGEAGVRGVHHADVNEFSGLPASRVVRSDFNVVRVGCTGESVHVDVRCLI